MTLQEMMQAAASGQGPRYAAGAPSAGGGGVMTGAPPGLDPQIEALIGEATAPEPYAAQPVPAKSKLWQRLLSAVADAGSAYSAGMGAGRPTDFTRALLGRDDYADQVTAANAAGKERSVRQSKKSAAELKLQTVLRQQQKAEDQAGREFLQKQTIADREQARKDAAQIADEKLRQDQAQFEAQKTWDREKLRLQGEQESKIASIHERSKLGDKSAEYDQKTLPEIMSNISGLVDVAPVALAGGDMAKQVPALNKDQMLGRVRRMIDGSMMSPDAKKAAYAFAERELGQAIKDFEGDNPQPGGGP